MHYCPQRKIVFTMPPRTGSTMFLHLLDKSGIPKFSGFRHIKPIKFPEHISIANGYTIYGFYRNPLDRFLSILRYVKKVDLDVLKLPKFIGVSKEDFLSFSYDQMLSNLDILKQNIPILGDPQVDWLADATCLNFNNYTQEILRVARMLDIKQIHVGVMNETEQTGEVPSQNVIDYVQSTYADDYRLGRERGLLV